MTPDDSSAKVSARIATIWRELFGDPRLSVRPTDDFFVLGASSLLCLRLVEALDTEFDVQIGLLSVIEDPTLTGLTRTVTAALEGRTALEFGEL